MSAEAELAKMWPNFLPADDTPIHLRGISPKGAQVSLPVKTMIFSPTEYPLIADRCNAFSGSALALNDRGYNIYTNLNPLKPDHVGNSVDDIDIACRRNLLIDIDRTGTLIASATDDEIAHAMKTADRIAESFATATDVVMFRVMSGNGIHLYLPLDDHPNDSQSKEDCIRLLKGLASRFDDDVVKVDTGVFNAGRITKVPGTIMRKGTETADRPYRMALVV